MELSGKLHKTFWGGLFTGLLLLGGALAAQTPSPRIWGKTVSGLQMTVYLIQQAESSQSKTPKFRVELHNAGKKDLSLNLGADCRGRIYISRVILTLIDSHGESERPELRQPEIICGAYQPLVRIIPVGASFTMPVDLDAYCPGIGELDYSMKTGPYSLEVQFTGTSVRQEELQLGQSLPGTPFWTGTVKSNRLRFEVLDLITLQR